MRFALFLAAPLLALACAAPAMAQQAPVPTLSPNATMLTVSASGSSNRAPDLATFSAGVATQGATAAAALSANAAKMNAVLAALRRAGIADRDVQTNTLSVHPVFAEQQRPANAMPSIVGYQATNTVSVRQRDLANLGKVIDTLVGAGANQVNGPRFLLDKPDAAEDEARVEAMGRARARAELYAKTAGLKVGRIVSISETGGYTPPRPVLYARVAMASPMEDTTVAAGEIEVRIDVSVVYELLPG